MSMTAVARKDFQDAVRSRSLWTLSVVFVGLAMLTTYMYVEFPELLGGEAELSGVGLGLFLAGIASLFIGLTAIVIAIILSVGLSLLSGLIDIAVYLTMLGLVALVGLGIVNFFAPGLIPIVATPALPFEPSTVEPLIRLTESTATPLIPSI